MRGQESPDRSDAAPTTVERIAEPEAADAALKAGIGEERLNRALNLISELIHSTHDFDSIIDRTVPEAAKALGSDTAGISMHENGHWVPAYVYGLPHQVIGAEMSDEEEFHAVLAVTTRKPVAIDDASNDGRVSSEHMKKWGVRALLVTPLVIGNTAAAVIFFHFHRRPFAFQPFHLDFAARLASSISLALDNARLFEQMSSEITERQRAEAELRRSRAYLSTVVDAAPLGIYCVGADFRIRGANPVARAAFGDTPDLVGRDFDEVVHAVWPKVPADELVMHFRRTLETGEACAQSEIMVERRDSSVTAWYEWQGKRVAMGDGRYAIVCYFNDISARVQEREAVARSEEKYRTLFNSMSDGFVVADVIFDDKERPVDVYGVEMNDTAIRSMEGDHTGRYLSGTDVEDKSYWCELFGRVALTGESVRVERWVEQDRKWLDFYVFKVGDPTARRIGAIFKDVSERKRRDEDRLLWESYQKKSEILESISDCFYALDEHLRFTYVNEGAQRAWGMGWSEIIGRKIEDVFPGTVDVSVGKFEEVLRSRMAEHYEFYSKLFQRWIDMHVYPTGNGIAVYLRDIHERKRVEERVRQAGKLEAIGTLAGGIAHDFNNMLAVIVGNAELALDEAELEPIYANLQQILNAAERSKDLVRQILTFSRKGSAPGQIVRVAPVLEETCQLLRASLPSTVRMELKMRADEQAGVLGDASRLQQVVVNLASNAAHAMRERGGELDITLTAVSGQDSLFYDDIEPGRYVKITVRDTGSGITSEVQQRMFEPFFTTKEEGQGTGMGLAVVYGIVKSWGGTIEVESEVGKGTKFSVLLPQVSDWPEAAGEGRQQEQAALDEKEAEDVGGGRPGVREHILFVDDEVELVRAGKIMLERAGYRVTATTSSAEAFKLFRERPYEFDLVITDQTMPQMTGVALARRLRAIRKALPIILCTGYSETLSGDIADRAGIRELVMKPITRKEMTRAVRRALDGSDEDG